MMLNYQAQKVYRHALAVYGANAQTLMCMEEMAELQKELCKNARGADNVEHIAEKIADVRIMLEQMALLYGCQALADNYRQAKLERLKSRLEECK